MLRPSESETEILLGNKQIFGVFFVVAILLGVAFYGGYMVGKAAPARPPAAPVATQAAASSSTAPPVGSSGETHTLPGDSAAASDANPTDATEPDRGRSNAPPLGTPKGRKAEPRPSAPTEAPAQQTAEDFTPEAGQEFLQVTAVQRDDAFAIARVLHAKGFRAHAVPKPGNIKLYRVLVGPLRDAGDLSTTRDALRKTGFREVIVQKY
ncbi:MAG TPA: SPOR domain-containing protein [Bryobacteraceae bacterium]|nr:SPOR domain-containing protein [Bryobacteraceae bacterium]